MAHHFEIRTTPEVLKYLKDTLQASNRSRTTLFFAAKEALELAVRVEGPPKPLIDWNAAERRATDRHCTLADLIFDEGREREPDR